MDYELSADQLAIEAAVGKICEAFDDDYWSEKDTKAEFPLAR